MIELSPDLLLPERARDLEWVEADGLGGFAMGTADLRPTRRYHALLTVARRPPVDRRVLLAGLEEQVETSSELFQLEVCDRRSRPKPGDEGGQATARLVGMAVDPWPRFTYRIGRHLLSREILVPHGHPAVLVRYCHLEGPEPLSMLVSPLLAGRSYHDLLQLNDLADPTPEEEPGALVFHPYDEEPQLWLWRTGWRYHHAPGWIEGVVYRRERSRGYQFREDLLRPGHLEFELPPGGAQPLLFSACPLDDPDPGRLLEAERDRRRRLMETEGEATGAAGRLLALAADRFRVDEAGGRRTILAGFPWFEDWGRDAFISLEGLAHGAAPGLARAVLETFASQEESGLIPNRFGDQPGATLYNSADASLWWMLEFGRLRRRHPEQDPGGLWATAVRIFRHYLDGTRFGIGVDPEDGLLAAAASGLQLTWMDAKVDDLVVTPRAGKPVELQGLWYEACRIVEAEAAQQGDELLAAEAGAAARRVRQNFHRSFWVEALGHYADNLTPDGSVDSALRPNQLIPMALPHRLVDVAHGRAVLEVVDRHLLTPYGLRTLSPEHRDYRGRYEGPITERDLAYHQGTVWPWLLGPYGRACLAYRGEEERPRLASLLEPLLDYLGREGLGNLPEVFDGDPPHAPGGCPAQAWSVAEVRRLHRSLHLRDPYDPVGY